MKVTLVNLPDNPVYEGFTRPTMRVFPLGLAYVAAYLERAGHSVTMIDAATLDLDKESTMQATLDSDPCLVGVGATTPMVDAAISFLGKVKAEAPEVSTVLGGAHASALYREVLTQNSGVLDFVVFGEGEESMLDVVDHMEGRSTGLDGVGWNSPSGVVFGKPRTVVKDLDVLPFPARHLLPMDGYRDDVTFGDSYLGMSTSRGCPYGCIFCASRVVWGRGARARSPRNVLIEVEQVVREYGITNLLFYDELFALDEDRVVEICRGIISLDLGLRISCSSRVDTMSVRRLDWMRRAGVFRVAFGMESGNDRILAGLKKGIRVEQIRAAVKMTKEVGLEVYGTFILGCPGDTEETMEETIGLAESLELDVAQFSILTPFPGTETHRMAVSRGLGEGAENREFRYYYSVVANMSEVSDERLLELQRGAYRRTQATTKKERQR